MEDHHFDGVIAELPYVEGTLDYLTPMTDVPTYYPHPGEPPVGVARYNGVIDQRNLRIHNVRPIAAGLSLERNGFTATRHLSAVQNFHDDEEVRRIYFPEIEALVAKALNASRVLVFDYSKRKRTVIGSSANDAAAPSSSTGETKRPFLRVHGDYTPISAPQRVRDLLRDEADNLLSRPFAIVNVWRPIRGPLRDAPLAVCDADTVSSDDLVACHLMYPDRQGQIYEVMFNPAHQWYYVPEMQSDEILLFKTYDSRNDGRARLAPHAAFEDPTMPRDALPRDSCEVRAFAFL